MKLTLTYKPEGVDPKSWEFEFERLLSPEVMAIEKLTKMSFGEWTQAVGSQSMTAIHALVWIFLKRETPALKPEQVTFSMADIDVELKEMTDAEAAQTVMQLRQTDDLDTDGEMLLARLEAQLAGAEEEAPKA